MSDLAGKTLGRYEIHELIGRGGMATVYSATQTSIGRKVAIKVMPPNFMSDQTFLERFEREVQLITRLQHPAILPVHDYGEEDGMPYIVMALLDGGSLSDLIKEGPMDIKDVERYVTQVAGGLDFAHQQGIIHRDFKPSNVLLDSQNNAYLADFGIAKVSESTSQLTGSGLVGTPHYMAPEMFDDFETTGQVDVYALGVTLYQMLAGETPFADESFIKILNAHINKPVPNILEKRTELPESIQWVIEKAMAKSPDDRYKTAGELAKDLTAAIGGEAIEPPPSGAMSPETLSTVGIPRAGAARKRGGSKVGRNVIGAVLLAVIIIGAGLFVLLGGDDGDEEPQSNDIIAAATESDPPTAIPDPTDEPTATPEPTDEPTATPQPTPTPDPFLITTNNITQIALARTLEGHSAGVTSVAWGPDGEQLASASLDGTIVIWDALMGTRLKTFREHFAAVNSVAWSPDGMRLASASADNTVVIWDVETGEQLQILSGHRAPVLSVTWSPDGKALASSSESNIPIIWDAETGEQIHTLQGHTSGVTSIAWSSEGTFLASGSNDGTVIIWDAETGEQVRTLSDHLRAVSSVAWSPDSEQLASGSTDLSAIIWNTATGQSVQTLTQTAVVTGLSWSPDNSSIAVATGQGGTIATLWDSESGDQLHTLEGHTTSVNSVSWSPDNKHLASASAGGSIFIWGVPE